MAINKTLYTTIIERLGPARVTREGEPMQAHYEEGGGQELPSLRITHFGESYCVRCPFCGSGSQCLVISHQYGRRDGRTGYRYLHLAKCFRKNCLADPLRRRQLADMLLGVVNRNRRSLDRQIQEATENTAAGKGNDPVSASRGSNDGAMEIKIGRPHTTLASASADKQSPSAKGDTCIDYY